MALQGLRKNATGVIQVVTGVWVTDTTTNSTAWTEVWNGVSITRTVTNSKFVISVNVGMGYPASSNTDAYNYALTIGRDGTPLNMGTEIAGKQGYYGPSTGLMVYGFTGSDAPGYGGGSYSFNYESTHKNMIYAETPAGAVGTIFRYGIFACNYGGSGAVLLNRNGNGNTNQGAISSMMIQEVTA